jgi:hypothetical protein
MVYPVVRGNDYVMAYRRTGSVCKVIHRKVALSP